MQAEKFRKHKISMRGLANCFQSGLNLHGGNKVSKCVSSPEFRLTFLNFICGHNRPTEGSIGIRVRTEKSIFVIIEVQQTQRGVFDRCEPIYKTVKAITST